MHVIWHALVVEFHQPHGHFERLLSSDPWSAKELLFALDRMPRTLWEHADLAKVHLSLSGTLLETLSSPTFQERVYGIVKLGDLLWYLQNEQLFEVLGSAYYHPLLPLITPEHQREHLTRWLGIGRHLLWRDRIPGFFPPELAFSMELIPLLRRLGYRYVVVDSHHLEAVDELSPAELRFYPHEAEFAGESLIIVPRDRALSNAQAAGMDAGWFEREVERQTNGLLHPLVTTATPGDGGGWFRNVRENFWNKFYVPLLCRYREGQHQVRPTHLDAYLDAHGTRGRVRVRPGAWNVGPHDGVDFTPFRGGARDHVLARCQRLSEELTAQHGRADEALLEQAVWRLLRAETSTHLLWAAEGVRRAESELDEVATWLERARAHGK